MAVKVHSKNAPRRVIKSIQSIFSLVDYSKSGTTVFTSFRNCTSDPPCLANFLAQLRSSNNIFSGWHLIKAYKMIDPNQANEELQKRLAMMEAQMQNAQMQLQKEREEKEKKDRLLNFQMEQRRREEDEQRRLRFQMLENEDAMRREIEQKERMLRAEREEKEMTMQMLKEKQNMLDR